MQCQRYVAAEKEDLINCHPTDLANLCVAVMEKLDKLLLVVVSTVTRYFAMFLRYKFKSYYRNTLCKKKQNMTTDNLLIC